jgi:hypothetical protein
MVLCYGSADGVGLRAQALYREKFPARVPHSQTFLAVVQRENGTFRPKNVDRGQEPRVLDLDPQIQETMDENP